MPNQYQLFKRSSVPNKVPTTSSLLIGEIAINTNDAIIYLHQSSSLVDRIIGLKVTPDSASYAISSSFAPVEKAATLGIVINGGGQTITTGSKGFFEVPFNCTIVGWTILSGIPTGSIVIDIWKDNYVSYPPTVADTITGDQKPTLSAQQKNQNLSLTAWTASLTKGDIIVPNVDSITNVQDAYLYIRTLKL